MVKVFADDVMTTALLDRLLHHVKVFSLDGESYRIQNRRQKAIFKNFFYPSSGGWIPALPGRVPGILFTTTLGNSLDIQKQKSGDILRLYPTS